MYTYTIVEKKDNDLETVIEKGNLTTRFTLQDVKDHLEFTEKTLKQTKAQIEIEDTQNAMAEEIIPILKDIPDDKWNLVMMYANRKVARQPALDIISTAEETIKSYTEQVKIIEEQLGLSMEEKVEIIEQETGNVVAEMTPSEIEEVITTETA